MSDRLKFSGKPDGAELAGKVKAMLTNGRLGAISTLAESLMAVDFSALDADPYALNCTNGTLDLRTGELRTHRAEDRITQITTVDYDAAATCPEWLRLLELYSAPKDKSPRAEWISFLQHVLGYALIGENLCEAILFFEGSGANGKGTITTTVARVLGDYAGPISAAAVEKEDTHSSALASAGTKRVLFSSEINAAKPIQAHRLKMLASDEALQVQLRMGGDFVSIVPHAKLIFCVNGTPRIAEGGRSITRRLHIVPFAYEIPDDAIDPQLKQRLYRGEAAGVLAWLVRGSQAFIADGCTLRAPKCVREASDDTLTENNPLAAWIEASCTVDPTAWTSSGDLWSSYSRWANMAREPHPLGSKNFGNALVERGYPRERTNDKERHRGHCGLRLRRGGPPMPPRAR